MQDMVIGDLDADEKSRAGRFLDRCLPDDPRTACLRELHARLVAEPAQPPGFFRRLRGRLDGWYDRLIALPLFGRVLTAFFVAQALFAVLSAVLTAAALWQDHPGARLSRHIPEGTAQWGRLISSLLSGALVVRGAVLLAISRRRAYESFRRATLLAIFATQFFVFYQKQLAGTPWLVFHLVVLLILQGMLRLERRRQTA
jgi:hypothetical protein